MINIKKDTWLSEIFAHNVFKIDIDSFCKNNSENIANLVKEHLNQQDKAFYYSKIDTTEIYLVKQLSSAGLYIVDVNVLFSRAPRPLVNSSYNKELIVCECPEKHGETVASIAASCFKYSRFHLDPSVSKNIADKIKYEWVLNYTKKKRGDKLFVALIDDVPAGFLAALTYEKNDEQIAVIDLVGVAEDFQKKGIGKKLINQFINEYKHCDELQVGTQIANIPSINLYTNTGFSLIGSQYVMHMTVNK